MRSKEALLDSVVLAIGAGYFLGAALNASASYARSLGSWFFDWQFYSAAVARWLAGEPIYPGDRISTLGSAAGASYAYPPASIPLMLPFSVWPVGALAWEMVIVGVLLAGLWAVVKQGWSRPRLAFGLSMALFGMVDGVTHGIAVGNVNIATAGAIGLVWAMPGTRVALPALLAVTKVFPLSLAAPFRASFIRASILGIAICVVTLPLVGPSSWASYATGLATSTPLCGDPRWANYSLACHMIPIVGAQGAKVLGVSLAALLLGLALWRGPSLAGITAAALATVVPATEVHAHYVAIPLMLVVIALTRIPARGCPPGHVPTPRVGGDSN